jgi:hypothetical protein
MIGNIKKIEAPLSQKQYLKEVNIKDNQDKKVATHKI